MKKQLQEQKVESSEGGMGNQAMEPSNGQVNKQAGVSEEGGREKEREGEGGREREEGEGARGGAHPGTSR